MSKSVKRVLKNSFFQTVGAVGTSGLNFILTIGYGRYLLPETYGTLVTMQAQVLVWALFVDLGLSNSLIGALTSAEGGRSELLRQGFRARDLLYRVLALRLGGAFLGTAFVYLLALAHHREHSESFWQSLAFAPYLFALALQESARGMASYRQKQGLAVGAGLFGLACSVALTLFLASRGASIATLLVAQSWGGFLAAGIIFSVLLFEAGARKRSGTSRRQESVRRGPWGKEAWKALGRDAWPYAIAFAVLVLWQRLDQLAVSYWLGFETGGQYAMAVRLVAIPNLVATSISFAIFPDLQRLGRDTPEQVRVILGALTKAVYRWGVLLIAVTLVILAFFVVPLLPKFREGLKLLPHFVPGIWAHWMHSSLTNTLFGIRQHRAVVKVHLLSLSVYLFSLAALPHLFGVYGVVWSFNLFCLAMCFFGFREAKKAGLLSPGYLVYGSYSAEEKSLWEKAGLRIFGLQSGAKK